MNSATFTIPPFFSLSVIGLVHTPGTNFAIIAIQNFQEEFNAWLCIEKLEGVTWLNAHFKRHDFIIILLFFKRFDAVALGMGGH
jgi:hypothetical protein